MKEAKIADCVSENAKKLFNFCHASLYNIIKRIFGGLKKRFKCIQVIPEYSISTQVNLVYAFTALHNFIVVHKNDANELDMWKLVTENEMYSSNPAGDQEPSRATFLTFSHMMNVKRDKMAEAMWNQY